MKLSILEILFTSETTAGRVVETIEAVYITAATCVMGSVLCFIGGNIAGALSVLIF